MLYVLLKMNKVILVTLVIKMLVCGVPKTPGGQTVSMTDHTSRNIQGAPTKRSTGEP